MGRRPQVRYFASKKGFYAEVNKKRTRLGPGPDDTIGQGPNFSAATKKYGELLCRLPGQENVNPTVDKLLDMWREHLTTNKKLATLGQLDTIDASVRKNLGDIKAGELQQRHIDGWLSGQKRWGQTTRGLALRLMRWGMLWGVARGHISACPWSKTKIPAEYKMQSRGEEHALPDGLLSVLMAGAQKNLREYMAAILATGARPGEIAGAEDYHYRPELRALVFSGSPRKGFVWKNARKTGKDRVVYLPSAVVEVVERNIEQNGKGYIFRTEYGLHWTTARAKDIFYNLKKGKAVQSWLRANGDDNDKHVILYALRHTFASRALGKNMPIKTLAELMGTSVAMIEKAYGHLAGQRDYLRSALDALEIG
jgi:integrase